MAAWSPFVAYSAAAALCTFALLSSYAQADCGGFALSCGSLDLGSDGWLRAICGNGAGGYSRASINLNAHISNSNGNLVDGAGFASSCRNLRWYQLGNANQGVSAECRRTDGSYGSTTLYNVQRRVANYGGNLVWNNCRRRSLLESEVSTTDSLEAIGELSARKLLKK